MSKIVMQGIPAAYVSRSHDNLGCQGSGGYNDYTIKEKERLDKYLEIGR